MKRIKKITKKIFKIISKPELRILPGNFAFFMLMSIIPIILLIGYIAPFFNISIPTLIEWINTVLPKKISDTLMSFIDGNTIDSNIVVFMIAEFIIASNGVYSLIITSNTLYKVKESNFLKRRIKAIILTILLIVLIIVMIFVLGFGNNILKMILNLKIFEKTSKYVYILFAFLKWPISFVIVFFIIKVLYVSSLDIKIPSKKVNKGAFFTTACWLPATAIFSYFVANFSNYDLFYGGLSNIAVIMIWLYLLSYILVVGIAINTTSYEVEEIANNNEE